MRSQIVWFETKAEALSECPWACDAFEIVGGWICFESWDDANTWNNQK
jgi:hypothetical protein